MSVHDSPAVIEARDHLLDEISECQCSKIAKDCKRINRALPKLIDAVVGAMRREDGCWYQATHAGLRDDCLSVDRIYRRHSEPCPSCAARASSPTEGG